MNVLKKISFFLIISFIFLPIIIGAYWVLEPFFQQINANNIFKTTLIQQAINYPTFVSSLLNTICVVFCSAILLFFTIFCIYAYLYNSKFWKFLEKNLPFILAYPHLSMAIGFSFLLSPSGWLVRLLGFDSPLSFQTINDRYGISLIIFFVLKELFFMLFMSIAPLNAPEVKQMYITSLTMGYSHIRTWIYVIYPYIRKKLIFPLFLVMVYITNNVDVASILGMDLPPVFSVLMLDWFLDSNILFHGYAGFGFFALMFIFLLLLLLIQGGMQLFRYLSMRINYPYVRKKRYDFLVTLSAKILLAAFFIIIFFSILSNIIWSFAERWRFPDIVPTMYTLQTWADNWSVLFDAISTTITLALISTVISIIITVLLLESMSVWKIQIEKTITALFIALLLMPPVMLSFGVLTEFLFMGIVYYFFTTLYMHCFYSIAYMYFILKPVFEKYDGRYSYSSLALGNSRLKTFLNVKIKMMAKSLIIASTIGFSVSTAQYVPTLFLGGGRIKTLPIEIMSVFNGANQRLMGLYGLLQAILPLVAYIISMWLIRKRRN